MVFPTLRNITFKTTRSKFDLQPDKVFSVHLPHSPLQIILWLLRLGRSISENRCCPNLGISDFFCSCMVQLTALLYFLWLSSRKNAFKTVKMKIRLQQDKVF